eukprot:2863954-Pleurochrysis_carterae.AAC.1
MSGVLSGLGLEIVRASISTEGKDQARMEEQRARTREKGLCPLCSSLSLSFSTSLGLSRPLSASLDLSRLLGPSLARPLSAPSEQNLA